ncbi:MAG: hypothetical protein ABI680_04870 [Chthoniobacteraceae bacterium]
MVHNVNINYLFNSFADGMSVNAVSSVNGLEVANDTFTWDGNGGSMFMEFGNNDAGSRAAKRSTAFRSPLYGRP